MRVCTLRIQCRCHKWNEQFLYESWESKSSNLRNHRCQCRHRWHRSMPQFSWHLLLAATNCYDSMIEKGRFSFTAKFKVSLTSDVHVSPVTNAFSASIDTWPCRCGRLMVADVVALKLKVWKMLMQRIEAHVVSRHLLHSNGKRQ